MGIPTLLGKQESLSDNSMKDTKYHSKDSNQSLSNIAPNITPLRTPRDNGTETQTSEKVFRAVPENILGLAIFDMGLSLTARYGQCSPM